MADNKLNEVGDRGTATSQDFDQFYNALVGNVLPRNSGGSVENEAGSLGVQATQWENTWTKNLYVNGVQVFANQQMDLSYLDSSNYITNGLIRGSGDLTPIFMQPNGSTANVDILGSSTNLDLVINNASVIVNTNFAIGTLTSAPATNNTCLVNDVDLTGQGFTKAIREIPIDTIGSEISALNGKIAGFKLGNEYFLAVVDTTNNFLLVDRRGSFIDDSGDAIERVAISDNDTITLMNLSWIFIENTATGGAFTNTNPIYSGTEPTGASTNDYWYNLDLKKWLVYDGASFVDANRVLIGVALTNSAGETIATRCIDRRGAYQDKNTITLRKFDDATLITDNVYNEVSVYGRYFAYSNILRFNMVSDLDSSLTEASDTTYYFYLTAEGKPFISDEIPEWRNDLQGAYFPYATHRFVAECRNDSSSNLVNPKVRRRGIMETITTTGISYWLKPADIRFVRLRQCGGGGGSGSTTAFGGAGAYAEKLIDLQRISYLKLNIGTGGATSGTSTPSAGGNTTSNGYGLAITTEGARASTTTFGVATGGDFNLSGKIGNNNECCGVLLGTAVSGVSGGPQGFGAGGNKNSGTGSDRNGTQGVVIIEYL
jgi:hypothetical protein